MSRARLSTLSMVSLVVVLSSCAQGGQTASPSAPVPEAPSARESREGAALPLVAGKWSSSDTHPPPEKLRWRREPSSRPEAALSVEVIGPGKPWYASFMAHKTIDRNGIPDDAPDSQLVLACGEGLTDPGCRITALGGHRWRVETLASAPEGHPYRMLYVQWPSARPGDAEEWASWQLPIG